MNITPLFQRDLRVTYCDKLSKERKNKALRLKSEREQARSIGAGYLLEQMLEESYGLEQTEIENLSYERDSHGKPYLTQYPDIHFNLSHSGDYVMCAVSEKEIGVDIQKIGAFKENVVKRFFSESEQEAIAQIKDEEEKKKLFYQIWAGKESYTKLLGTGLTIPLGAFTVDVVKKKVADTLTVDVVKKKVTDALTMDLATKKVTGIDSCNLSYHLLDSEYVCCIASFEEQDSTFQTRKLEAL